MFIVAYLAHGNIRRKENLSSSPMYIFGKLNLPFLPSLKSQEAKWRPFSTTPDGHPPTPAGPQYKDFEKASNHCGVSCSIILSIQVCGIWRKGIRRDCATLVILPLVTLITLSPLNFSHAVVWLGKRVSDNVNFLICVATMSFLAVCHFFVKVACLERAQAYIAEILLPRRHHVCIIHQHPSPAHGWKTARPICVAGARGFPHPQRLLLLFCQGRFLPVRPLGRRGRHFGV